MASLSVSDVGKEYGNYRIVREISRGVHGKAFEVEVIRDFTNDKFKFRRGMRLAMKEHLEDVEVVDINEIDILNRIDHRNVTNSYDTFRNNINDNYGKFESDDGTDNCDKIFLILPLASYNLNQLIKSKNNHPDRYRQEDIINICYQLMCGLHYLHSNHIIHDDIKPDNILVFEDNDNNRSRFIVKISDFGLSVTNIGSTIEKLSQTIYWRPPEILEDVKTNRISKAHSYESDIWAMGVVFLNLITGKNLHELIPNKIVPLNDADQLEVIYDFFLDDGLVWKNDPGFRGIDEIGDLIEKMLTEDPSIRIPSVEAILHNAFTGFCERVQIGYSNIELVSGILPLRKSIFERIRSVVSLFVKDSSLRYPIIFLTYDVFDRYIDVLTRDNKINEYSDDDFNDFAVVSIYLTLSIQMIYPNFLEVSYTYGLPVDKDIVQLVNIMCDMLEALDWVVYRETLNIEYPDINHQNLYKCYLETPNPTLSCVEKKR